ncbi:10509_t:CDS:2 [Acaulospora colombiana]|uniref:10509_t:CDS:1 n=1 Tax=Acaulospora colombiana TaxID=27376 RepID=A0ACA9LZS9_9GLOM|nr:10509_t:CDS:2 [Acaulospora colombiana]
MSALKKLFKRKRKHQSSKASQGSRGSQPDLSDDHSENQPTISVSGFDHGVALSTLSQNQTNTALSSSLNANTVISSTPPSASQQDPGQPIEQHQSPSRINQDRIVELSRGTTEALSVVKAAADMTSASGPLKAACGIVTQVLLSVQEMIVVGPEWESLAETLGSQSKGLEFERERYEQQEKFGYPVAANDSFRSSLENYLGYGAFYFLAAEAKGKQYLESALSSVKRGAQGLIYISTEYLIECDQAQIETCIELVLKPIQNDILKTYIDTFLVDSVEARGDRVPPLLPGTRTALITRLCEWSKDTSLSEQIFWLCDEAGTGKSTLAAHMASLWESQGILAGRFFFSRDDRYTDNIDRFCVTIARDIVSYHPGTQTHVRQVLMNHPDISSSSFSEIFRLLIVKSVEKASQMINKPLILVVDAVDECHPDGILVLAEELRHAMPSTGIFKVLMTSRYLLALEELLQGSAHVGGRDAVLLDVKGGALGSDVTLYIQHQLQGFDVEQVQVVIDCAKGVFLWAYLACTALNNTSAPSKLLERLRSMIPDKRMRQLYETVLEEAMDNMDSLEWLRIVLWGVILTYQPVSIFTIKKFFEVDQDAEEFDYVEYFVKKLGSIMKDGKLHLPIYTLHPSFRQYLEEQTEQAKFYISPPMGHAQIAIACCRLLKSLTPGALEGVKPGRPYKTGRPENNPDSIMRGSMAPVRYAVTFWARHASLAIQDEDLRKELLTVLQEKLLVWMEWSGVLKEISECLRGLDLLHTSLLMLGELEIPTEWNKNSLALCQDASNLLKRFSYLISTSPLHTYMSALAFTSHESLLFQTYHDKVPKLLPWFKTQYVDRTTPHREVLRGVTFQDILVSPNGKRFLPIPNNSVLHLFNADTVQLLATMEGHHSRVRSAAFSADSSCIVSGGDDSFICIWDGSSGRLIEMLSIEHEGAVTHVTFCKGGNTIISTSIDGTIRCWARNPSERNGRAQILHTQPKSEPITGLVASLNGRFLAACSQTPEVLLWEVESLEQPYKLPHNSKICKILFTRDGRTLISGCENGQVCIWDTRTSAIKHTIDAHDDAIRDLAINSDNSFLVSGPKYSEHPSSIRIWRLADGQEACPPLEQDIHGTRAIDLDRRGRRLAIISTDEIHIWDIQRTGKKCLARRIAVLTGPEWDILAMRFLPDGERLISSSLDRTLRLWELGSDLDYDMNQTRTIKWKTSEQSGDVVITCLAFSGGGEYIVCGNTNSTLQLWDTRTGSGIGDPYKIPEAPEFVTFSIEEHVVGWGGSQGNVGLWGVDTHSQQHETIFKGHKHRVISGSISRSGHLFVTGSVDRSCKVWNTSTGKCEATIACTESVGAVALSDDESYIVMWANDHSIRLWSNVARAVIGDTTNMVIQTKVQLAARAPFLQFSPDSSMLLCTSNSLGIESSLEFFTINPANGLERIISKQFPFFGNRPSFFADSKHILYGTEIFDIQIPSNNGDKWDLRPLDDQFVMEPLEPASRLVYRRKHGMSEIYSIRHEDPLLILPRDFWVQTWASHGNLIAFGSNDDRLLLLSFADDDL